MKKSKKLSKTKLKNKTDSVKKAGLVIAIAIILALFVSYGVRTFYEEPEWDDFIPQECKEKGFVEDRPVPIMKTNMSEQERQIYNENCFTKPNEVYDQAREKYETVYFITMTVTGLIALIVGLSLSLSVISNGLLYGGILNIFIGTVSYWSRLFDFIRFIILGAVLAIIIWISYKKFNKK